jgi:hypothetical protein
MSHLDPRLAAGPVSYGALVLELCTIWLLSDKQGFFDGEPGR